MIRFMAFTQLLLTLVLGVSAFAKSAAEIECEARLEKAWKNTQAMVQTSAFTVRRDFAWYGRDFTADDVPTLADLFKALKRGSTWMDFGAGRAIAMRQVLKGSDFKNIEKFVATSFSRYPDRDLVEDLKNYAEKFKHVETGFIDEALNDPGHEIHHWKNSVDFLTDDFGPGSYVKDLQQILEFYGDVLKDGGRALVLFLDTNVAPGEQVSGGSICGAANWIGDLTGGRLKVAAAGLGKDQKCILLLERVPRAQVTRPAIERRLVVETFDEATPPKRSYRITPDP
jgi:SAM-dependent methyltransferase